MASGSIVARPSKRNPRITFYYVVVTSEGRQKWHKAGTTYKDAEHLRAELMRQIYRGEYQPLKKATFEEFYETWLEKYAEPKFRPSSLDRTKGIFRKHFLPRWKDKQLKSIGAEDIQGFVAKALKDGVSAATVVRALTPLKTLFKCAVKWGYLSKNPLDDIERPSIDHKEMDILEPDEIERFLRAVREGDEERSRWDKDTVRWYPLFATAVLTGMRQGELLGLMWGDIDFTHYQIHVRRSLTRDGRLSRTKTKKGVRKVVMSPRLSDILAAWKIDCPANDLNLVFVNTLGKPLDATNLVRPLNSSLTRAGLRRIRFHDLRHTNAALRIAANQNIKAIQEQLGHASITMTLDTYGHLFKASHNGVGEALDSLVFRGEIREPLDRLEIDPVTASVVKTKDPL